MRSLLDDAGVMSRRVALTPEDAERTDRAAEVALAQIIGRPLGNRPSGTSVCEAPTRTGSARSRWPRLALVSVAVTTAVAMLVAVWWQPWQATPTVTAGVQRHDVPPLVDVTDLDHAPQAGAKLNALSVAADAQQSTAGGLVQRVIVDTWTRPPDQPDTAAAPSLATVRSERLRLPDGTLRIIDRRGATLDDSGRFTADTTPGALLSDTVRHPSGGPLTNAIVLPDDPAQLAALLQPSKSTCPDLTACVVSELTDLHYTQVPTPEVAAALWTLLAQDSSVRYLGQRSDPLGRHAWAFAAPESSTGLTTIIFADPATGALLGTEQLDTADPHSSPTTPVVVRIQALLSANRLAAGAASTP